MVLNDRFVVSSWEKKFDVEPKILWVPICLLPAGWRITALTGSYFIDTSFGGERRG